jgi:hypothetical protein
MNVQIEWVSVEAKPPVFSDQLALSTEFEDWTDPLPRVGDNLSPPIGPMQVYGKDRHEWVVTSVTWELSSDAESAWLSCVVIVVHETPIDP